ncbi:CRISPR-associated protein Csx20 [Desulfobulbus alkaliphilus]|uniref:CRISPR-associated protein Csx20 n=1 Tax=Desulfobulbus alkaliphilus TaxID=869814 RepID=UPI001963F445|nr:CRISPR-associated protein Csx20 [Desulfobulbus alkaliphilus]MBM9536295.1 hypothetical protein [Desulfobulbus alkaliphilus]
MHRLFLFFNHTITLDQQNNARTELGVTSIVEPPLELSRRWANIPPTEASLRPWLQPILAWLREHAQPGDFILVQGEFGACYLLVRFALEQGYIPVYATTERHAREERLADGRIKLEHTFAHVRFRRYGE